MTVETVNLDGTPVIKSGPYNGNGVTTVFNYDFRITDETDIKVTRQNADLTEDILTLTTDYTVTDVGNVAGGTIVLVDAADLPTGSKLVIQLDMDFNQGTAYSNQGRIQLSLLEDSLDRLTLFARQLRDETSRAITVDAFGTTDREALRSNVAALAAIEDDLSALAASLSSIETVAADIAAVIAASGHAAAAEDAADRAEAVGIFDTDASYAAWDATNTPANDRLYLIAGRPYRGQTAAAVIPGKSGLIPWQLDGRTDIRQLGGIGSGADETSSFQALYDAGAHGSAARVSKGNTAWQCASPVTLSGSKRLFYEVDTDADFASETDFLNAIPEYSNSTGQKFLRNKHFSIAIAGSGGVEEWSTRFLPSDPLVAGQKDAFRQTGVMLDPSEGTSWGTAGANVNHDMVIHTPIAFVMGAHDRHSAFTINPSMYYFAGADGQGRVVEGNLWMDAATALVTSMTDVRQKGVFAAILKPGSQAATYAYTFGGGAFVKGLFATQASLLNHTDTRFIQLENFFNVYRTGLLVGGKAASSLYSAGYELNATGEFFLTANAVSALQIFARQDQLTGSALTIGSLQARGLNTAAVQKVFSEIQLVSQDGTSGSEDGGIVFLTALAGSAASERVRIREGISLSGGQQKTRMTYTTHSVSFASMAAGTGTSVAITVSGVLAGDGIAVTLANALASLNLVYRWAHTAVDTITVYAYNPTAGVISPAAGASIYVETTRYQP